ncbi:MAG: filamentous hemagglutinin N-terminal domain-containing protein, partial [Rivularia sp. ALOHA_DT_140]|nr:filamentous hemagglutinin N-terminal domain-containing protein [Rivularia sp. ALOHA_DT_140]
MRKSNQFFTFIALISILPCLSVKAQLIPDNSLGSESSQVNPSMGKDLIEGGAIRDNNLFHSFKEFNVNLNQKVYFSNPDNITNILTRVTGTNASKIFGTLGVDGSANLFLINPNGIVFGKNAALDISGSFSATTAESIFIDSYEFSAVNPSEKPLLKVNLTPGLQYGKINPGSEIENQGVLKVSQGENLTLLGGKVNHTGSLIAPGGKVEISGDEINLSGIVDTSHSNGEFGTLLIDPKNILIAENGDFTGENISQALALNNVILQANNDITVDDDITGIGTNNLTLETGRSLTIGENRNIILNGGSFNAKINDENALPSERDTGIDEFKMN